MKSLAYRSGCKVPLTVTVFTNIVTSTAFTSVSYHGNSVVQLEKQDRLCVKDSMACDEEPVRSLWSRKHQCTQLLTHNFEINCGAHKLNFIKSFVHLLQ